MGSGIAQLAAMAGYEVTLCDTAPEQLERARGQISVSIDKLTGKGRMDREAGRQALRRVQLSGSLAEAAAGADLVIEAVAEVLAVKQSVVRGLQTSDATVTAARQFAQTLGKDTVVCMKDSPGFLTSRISAIVRLECL